VADEEVDVDDCYKAGRRRHGSVGGRKKGWKRRRTVSFPLLSFASYHTKKSTVEP